MEMMALDKESYPSIAHSLPFRSFHRLRLCTASDQTWLDSIPSILDTQKFAEASTRLPPVTLTPFTTT